MTHGQVTKKLVVDTPPTALIDAYLTEIAKGYGLTWLPPEDIVVDSPQSTDDVDDAPDGGVKVRDTHACVRFFLSGVNYCIGTCLSS